jgi:hypothetical protein
MKIKPALVKRQALLVSSKLRAGKFNRVSQDFLDQVEADVDTLLRRLVMESKTQDPILAPVGKLFTPLAEDAILAFFNQRIAVIVQNRIRQHPSVGKTLKG